MINNTVKSGLDAVGTAGKVATGVGLLGLGTDALMDVFLGHGMSSSLVEGFCGLTGIGLFTILTSRGLKKVFTNKNEFA